jgi:hypothetical protein
LFFVLLRARPKSAALSSLRRLKSPLPLFMRSPIEDRAVYFCVVVLKSGKTLFFEERAKKHAARHGDFLFF